MFRSKSSRIIGDLKSKEITNGSLALLTGQLQLYLEMHYGKDVSRNMHLCNFEFESLLIRRVIRIHETWQSFPCASSKTSIRVWCAFDVKMLWLRLIQGGSLCTILTTCFQKRSEFGWEDFDLFSERTDEKRALQHHQLMLAIREALWVRIFWSSAFSSSNCLRMSRQPVNCVSRMCTLTSHSILQMRWKWKVLSNQKAALYLHPHRKPRMYFNSLFDVCIATCNVFLCRWFVPDPGGPPPPAEQQQDFLRTIQIRGDSALVHW